MTVSYTHDDDPIAPARGVVNGVLLSFLGWMPLFAVVMFFIWRES
jgi:hypothetical protein